MTTSLPPLVFAAFSAERDRRLIAPPLRMPDRTRELIARESGGLCVFCGNSGNTLSRLIPHGSGGPSRMPNLVYSCRACHKKRGHGDWDALEFAQSEGRSLSPALLAQRDESLALCPQHPVPPAARRTLAECRAHLSATRWVHPRVPFLVASVGTRVLLAVLQLPTGAAGENLLSVVRETGGRAESGGVWSIGAADWTKLAWRLIDQHAILFEFKCGDMQAELRGSPAGVPWHERWNQLFHDVAEARRDAPRKPLQGFRAGSRTRAWLKNQPKRA